MSLTTRVIAGLALGLAAGAAAHFSGHPLLLGVADLVEPIGTIWVNAILMTVIPLVVSSLIVGVASTADARAIGRLGWQALLLFLLFCSVCAVFTALTAPPLLARLAIDPGTVTSIRAGAVSALSAHAVTTPPGVGQWLTGVVPSNAVKAAADGAMLPLVVFTVAFALAATRIKPDLRHAVLGLFEAVAAAMRVLIEWILACAPVGVFGLAFPLAARVGISAIGALGYYVALVSATCVLLLLALYPVAAVAGGVGIRAFARAVAPAQAVAFSSRSSLASLPALIDGAERLGLPPAVTGFCLPLAVSTFKFCGPVVTIGGMLFIGRLYGIPIDSWRLVQAAALAVLLTFAVPGIPGGALIVGSPIFVAAGLPLEGIGMLLAVDTIPDMFRAPANVTADLTVATILARTAHVVSPPARVTAENAASIGV
jgi:Na+/H+-dicarboxylate symporter